MGTTNMTLGFCARCENRRHGEDLREQNGVSVCEDCRTEETGHQLGEARAESVPIDSHPTADARRVGDEQYDIAEHRF